MSAEQVALFAEIYQVSVARIYQLATTPSSLEQVLEHIQPSDTEAGHLHDLDKHTIQELLTRIEKLEASITKTSLKQ